MAGDFLRTGSDFGQIDIDCKSTVADGSRVFGVYKGTSKNIEFFPTGAASFKSLLQVERDDVTIGGQASVISFTAKTDSTTKGLIVYKCNGILEYRDSTNTPVITFDPKGIVEAKGYQFENLPSLP